MEVRTDTNRKRIRKRLYHYFAMIRLKRITTEWDGEYEDLGKVDIFPGIIDVHNHGFGGCP